MSNAWFERRTYRWWDWPVERLIELKRQRGTTVSLVIPARNEQATVGGIVSRVRAELVEAAPLLDEVVVMDSDSTDATGQRARAAGATVHRTADVRPDLGHHPGKGEAMWKSLFATSGDVVAFMDADLVEWDTHFVYGLLGPLLAEPGVSLVKAFYDRVLEQPGVQNGDSGSTYEGGRVTELVARPIIALRWPELSGIVQPLSGEWAVRRELIEDLSLPTGYGVELAALVDTHLRRGVDALAQVDMGRRAHRHQSLRGLGAMATELLAAADRRSGLDHGTGAVQVRQYGSGGAPQASTASAVERAPAGRAAAQPGPSDAGRKVVGRC